MKTTPTSFSCLVLVFCQLSAVLAFAEKPAELNKMRFELEVELAELVKPLQNLNTKYREHLEKQKGAFQQAGNLEAILAVDAELKIFEADLTKEFSPVPELKRLQQIYREQKRKVNNEIIKKKLPLIQSYSEKAKELSVQWTKKGKLDDAKIALEESKSIAAMASDPSLMAAIPETTPENPTPSTGDGTPAATSPTVFRSLDEILSVIPESMLKKVGRASSLVEGIAEANTILQDRVKNERMEIAIKPLLVDTSDSGGRKFRLKLPQDLISRNSGDIRDSNFWAYFSKQSPLDGSEIRANEEVVLGARIGRCDLIEANGKPRLCVDLQETEVVAPK